MQGGEGGKTGTFYLPRQLPAVPVWPGAKSVLPEMCLLAACCLKAEEINGEQKVYMGKAFP